MGNHLFSKQELSLIARSAVQHSGEILRSIDESMYFLISFILSVEEI
jgi:hypothetical protein